MDYSVYCLENRVNGLRYVGLTNNLNRRIWAHKTGADDMVIQRAVKKHGWDNFIVVVLEEGISSLSEASQLEKEYIKKFNSFGAGGYNCTEGGEGTVGVCGENHSQAKINEDTAKRIIADPRHNKTIADELGLDFHTIGGIRRGKSWKWLDRSNAPEYESKAAKPLTDEEAMEIIMSSESSGKIAKSLGRNIATVSSIRTGKLKPHLDRSDAPEYNHGLKVLNEEKVREIVMDPCSHEEASVKFGIPYSSICSIRRGRMWKNIDRSTSPKYRKGKSPYTKRETVS